MALATFGAGCFWGVEAAFRKLDGVAATSVGYMGGHVPDVNYGMVCTGTTGHAEVVQVEFDPDRVSYEDLLQTFWSCHDPTQVNRQGPDIGTQYRTAIFCHDDAQTAVAEASKQALEGQGYPIATKIEPVSDYWIAEDYHQQYFEKRGGHHGSRLFGMFR